MWLFNLYYKQYNLYKYKCQEEFHEKSNINKNCDIIELTISRYTYEKVIGIVLTVVALLLSVQMI